MCHAIRGLCHDVAGALMIGSRRTGDARHQHGDQRSRRPGNSTALRSAREPRGRALLRGSRGTRVAGRAPDRLRARVPVCAARAVLGDAWRLLDLSGGTPEQRTDADHRTLHLEHAGRIGYQTCSTSVRSERQRTALDGTFTANTNRWPSGLLTVLSCAGAPTGVGISNSARGARASNAGLVETSTAITVCRGGCDR